MSAFLNLNSNSILMKTESLEPGREPEISGAIVKRQQKKKSDDGDAGDGIDDEKEGESPREKKRKKEAKVPATPADGARDTAEKFEYILRHGIMDAQKQNPGKVIVAILDGGGPHTCEPFPTLRPGKSSDAEIKERLTDAGLWPKGEKPTARQAKTIYINSPIPRTQWTNAELIALELGAIVVYIPLNHPHLNVIEQVWRAVKQHYRIACVQKNLANMLATARAALTRGKGSEHVCSVGAIKRRKWRTWMISRHLAANPEADPLAENKLRGKKFKPSPEIDVSQVPKFGNLTIAKNLLHARLYAHHGNQARIKQFTRGVVSAHLWCCCIVLPNSYFAVHGLGKRSCF